MGGTAPFTEASRVAALINEWRDGGWSYLAIQTSTGIDERTLRGICSGNRQVVGFDVLDRLITGMQELHRCRMEFADVYEQVAPTTA